MDKRKMLELSTKKSLYKPIQISVDGKVYDSVMITADLFEKIAELDKKVKEGDISAIAEQLEIVFGVPLKIAKKLDLREISADALDMISQAILKPEKIEAKQEGEAEKNAGKPGDKESQGSQSSSQVSQSKSL